MKIKVSHQFKVKYIQLQRFAPSYGDICPCTLNLYITSDNFCWLKGNEVPLHLQYQMRFCDNVYQQIIRLFRLTEVFAKLYFYDNEILWSEQKSQLKTHVESVHDRKKPFSCTLCDHTSSRTGDLNRHIKTLHEIENQTVHNRKNLSVNVI